MVRLRVSRPVKTTGGAPAALARLTLELYSAFLDDRQRTPLIRLLVLADASYKEWRLNREVRQEITVYIDLTKLTSQNTYYY